MRIDKRNHKKTMLKESSFFLFSCILLIMMLTLLSVITVHAQEEMKRSIQIINPRPDFTLALRLDKGVGGTYTPGENIRISFRTTRNAYITLFGYDTQGNVKLLFPNQYQKNQYIEAGREYVVEGIIDPATVPGIEYLQGFATLEPVIMTRELERRIEQEYLPRIGDNIQSFTSRIRGILTGLPSQRWVASEVIHYQVVQDRSQVGRLQVNSFPEGAEVYLNERYAGRTPLNMDQVRIGEYTVRLEHPGDFQIWSRTIRINPNQTSFVNAELQRIQRYGTISIRSNEENANIYLDGQYRGRTERNRNVVLEDVSEGFHDLLVTLPGYRDWSQRVEVRSNQRVQINANLERIARTGSLTINSNVDNAMIYLNGTYYRRTSANRDVTIENLQEGSYELRVSREGYQDFITTVRINSGQTNRMTVRMQPEIRKGSISIRSNESNGRVFVNGIYKLTTSANQTRIIEDLDEGLYEIVVMKDGFRTWLDEIMVYSGETTSVYVNLNKVSN